MVTIKFPWTWPSSHLLVPTNCSKEIGVAGMENGCSSWLPSKSIGQGHLHISQSLPIVQRRLVLLEWNEKWIQFMVTIKVNWSRPFPSDSFSRFFGCIWWPCIEQIIIVLFSQFFVKFSEKSIQKKIPFRSSLMISLRCMCSKLWMYNNDEDDDVNSIIHKDIFVHLRLTIRIGKQQFGQHIKILYGILLFEPTSLKYWSNSLKS